ncbi:MAG TPA: universal stress protein [Corynebacteriales bacterium]|nr:universal stress protein [Mycobacteriales bacterium]
MHRTLHILTLWHPTFAHGAYTAPAETPTLPEDATLGDAILGGEAIYLAAALSALGRTYVQAVAPHFPDDTAHGWAKIWTQIRSKLGQEPEQAGTPKDVLRSLGRAGIGVNHLVDPAVLAVTATSPHHAFQQALAMDECVTPDVLCVGPGSGATMVQRVLQTNIPVAVAPAGYPGSPSGIRRVTCTYDGSPYAQQALRVATELAEGLDAEVRVSTTTPPPVDDADTIVRPESATTPVLDAGCELVQGWSGGTVLVAPDGDWSMQDEESTAEARWLPEELLVFGHAPTGDDAIQWETESRRFSIPYVLVPQADND